MTIIKRKRRDNFALIPNHVADDERLSFEARGVLLYLLAKPDQWEVTLTDLQRKGSMGRDRTLRILKELEEVGYIKRERARDDAGSFTHMSYLVDSDPIFKSDPHPEKAFVDPRPENPEEANPAEGFQGVYKENTEKKNTPPPTPKGEEGGRGFSVLWNSWGAALPDNREYAEKQFAKLDPAEQAQAIEHVAAFIALCFKRGKPAQMVTYLKSRLYLELIDAPPTDGDGDFIITPGRPEWREWMGDIRKRFGATGVESCVKRGNLITKSRWPEGHANGKA